MDAASGTGAAGEDIAQSSQAQSGCSRPSTPREHRQRHDDRHKEILPVDTTNKVKGNACNDPSRNNDDAKH